MSKPNSAGQGNAAPGGASMLGDASQIVREDLSSTQYVILSENQRKKKALFDTKQKYNALLQENKMLLEEREANQLETYEVTEFLRKEILRKNERIVALEEHLAQREEHFAQELASTKAEAAEKLKNAQDAWHNQELEFQHEIVGLQRELRSIRDFKERQQEVESEMARLREENEDLRQSQEARAAELERRFIEQNTKQKKEYERRLEELKKASEEDVDERLDASVKRILQQNRRMAEELRLHVQETDGLTRERRMLEEENTRLTRELTLRREVEEQFAKRGSKQARDIKDARARVESLEKSLGQMARDFDSERTERSENHMRAIADKDTDVEGLRRLVKLRTRELKNIRRLAQQVVDQRSEVEAFLIDSIAHVKEQKAAEGGRSGRLPSLGAGPARPSDASSRVDVRDLAWEDREKVLRILFGKVNAASPQAYYASLPAHSFGSAAMMTPGGGMAMRTPATASTMAGTGSAEGPHAPV
ncbi:flagellar/basal body protein [Pycnococcus provasolii]